MKVFYAKYFKQVIFLYTHKHTQYAHTYMFVCVYEKSLISVIGITITNFSFYFITYQIVIYTIS